MTEIRPNFGVLPNQNVVRQAVRTPNGQIVHTAPPRTLKDEFAHQHKKNGLVERLYNGIKNLTRLGTGSKKVQAAIAKAEKGEITEEQARATIDKYRKSQVNSAQILGDSVSIAAAGGTFFALNKYGKYITAGVKVNKPLEEFIVKLFKEIGEEAKGSEKEAFNKLSNIINTTLSTLKSNKKMLAITVGLSALAGATTKWLVQKFNRIGSKEFKINKKDYNGAVKPQDKMRYKADRKAMRKARRRTNWRNFLGGAINGLMMPLNFLGGFIGTPLYLLGNTLNRYFVSNREEKGQKSIKGYWENLKNDAVIHLGLAVAAGIPMAKKANWTKAFNESIDKAVAALQDAKLQPSDLSTQSTYEEIKDIIVKSDEIQAIIDNPNLSDAEKAGKLVETNIFAAKMKQIETGDNLARVLKENCPPTRCFRGEDGVWNFDNIQNFVNNALGEGYSIKKCLGVGTVAETYLVTDPAGKDVCIKVLKEGMSAEKIRQDADVIRKLINELSDDVANSDKKKFLIDNLDDLLAGILKEVNLEKEAEAAERIAKVTTKANVVKPILCKNGVYVMEKAEGITLSSFLDLAKLYTQKQKYESWQLDTTEIVAEINRLKERMPDCGDISFDEKDSEYILNEFRKVFVEQFHKIDPNGKTIHGDIHSSNIFINLDALKTRKGQLFTLIDTGNVIDMSTEQALRALNISKYIENGNVPEIVEYVLEGAKYPGKTKEQVRQILTDELNALFFGNKIQLGGTMNEASVLALTDGIMQKHQIIPGSTQLNLCKTRHSAGGSLEQIASSLKEIEQIKLSNDLAEASLANAVLKGGKHKAKQIARNKAYEAMIAAQEKANLLKLTSEQAHRIQSNPTALETSSEKYVTYKLKQNIFSLE